MEKRKICACRKPIVRSWRRSEALMAEETFDDITVNELCARALIRRPTFYSHFEDKYDFLRFYLNEIQWQIESESRLPRPTRPLSISSARGARSSPL
ncbi:MAG: TetR family transcriptional regulator [Oscillospiraceae bacterium]